MRFDEFVKMPALLFPRGVYMSDYEGSIYWI